MTIIYGSISGSHSDFFDPQIWQRCLPFAFSGMSFPEKVKFRHALQIILGSVKLYLPCALPCISEDSLQPNEKAAVSEPPESVIGTEMGNDLL